MAHGRCGVCRRRVPSNEIKNKAGAPLRWPVIEKYAEKYNLVISKTDPVCGKCDPSFSFRKGERIKIPFYVSPITDENQKGRPSRLTKIFQNPSDSSPENFESDRETIENPLAGSLDIVEMNPELNQLPASPPLVLDLDQIQNSQDCSQQSSCSSESQKSSENQNESSPGVSDAETLFSQESFDNYIKNTQLKINGFSLSDVDDLNIMEFVGQGQRSLVTLDISGECYPCNNATSSKAIHTCNLNQPPCLEIPEYLTSCCEREDSLSTQSNSSQEDEPNNDFDAGFSDATTIFSSCDLNFNSQSQNSFNSLDLQNDLSDLDSSQPSQHSAQQSQSNSISSSTQISDLQSDSQMTSQSSIVSEAVSMTSSIMKPPGFYLPFRSFKQTDRKCFICDSSGKASRCRVSKICAVDLGMKTNILIGPNVRACNHHTKHGLFTDEAIKIIKQHADDPVKSTKDVYYSNEEIVTLIKDMFQFMRSIKSDLDFGLQTKFNDEDYQVLLGIKKEHFEDLFSIIGPKLKNSCHRSTRNALALFLMKMRLNLSQQVLGILFGGIPQASVSETIDRVSRLLDKYFVPLHLGYSEERREKIHEQHQSQYASKICQTGGEHQVTVWDGTYIYVGKPSGHSAQRDIYSSQKKRSLVKEMMIVTPTGYIVNCDGAYRAADNDAKIMNTILMDKSQEGIWSLVEEGDFFILDRGFKESEEVLAKLNLKHIMPKFMKKKQHQFTTQEANDSRIVTLLRWVVEVVNGRVKNIFRFFDGAIPASYIPKIHCFFRIVCAIINAYHPPIFEDREIHEDLAIRIFERVHRKNDLMTRIEEQGLDRKRKIWTLGTAETIPDFPVLSIDDLQRLTLGVYQVNMAELYTREHLKSSAYVIYFNTHNNNNNKTKNKNPKSKNNKKNKNSGQTKIGQNDPRTAETGTSTEKQNECTNVNEIQEPPENRKLIMAKMHSRYSNSKVHKTFLEYDPEKQGDDSILGWYCSCQCGARTLGCCSHIASVMWFLGYSRHQQPQLAKRRNLCDSIINATERFRQQEIVQLGGIPTDHETRGIPDEIEKGHSESSDPSCSDDGHFDLSENEEILQNSSRRKVNRKRPRLNAESVISSDDENDDTRPRNNQVQKRPRRTQRSKNMIISTESDQSSDSEDTNDKTKPCKRQLVNKSSNVGRIRNQSQRRQKK